MKKISGRKDRKKQSKLRKGRRKKSTGLHHHHLRLLNLPLLVPAMKR